MAGDPFSPDAARVFGVPQRRSTFDDDEDAALAFGGAAGPAVSPDRVSFETEATEAAVFFDPAFATRQIIGKLSAAEAAQLDTKDKLTQALLAARSQLARAQAELQGALRKADTEKETMSLRLAAHEARAKKADRTNENLTTELESVQESLVAAKGTVLHLEGKLEQARSHAMTLQNMLDAAYRDRDVAIAQLEQGAVKANEDAGKLQALSDHNERLEAALHTKDETTKSDLAQLRQSLVAKDREAKADLARFQAALDAKSEELTAMQDEAAHLQAALSAKSDAAEADVATLQAALYAKDDATQRELAAALDAKDAELAQLRATLDAKDEANEARVAQLRQDLAAKEEKTEAAVARVRAALESKVTDSEAERAQLQAALDAKDEATEAEVARLQAALVAKDKAVEDEVAQLRAALDAKDETAKGDVERLQAALAAKDEEARAEASRLEAALRAKDEASRAEVAQLRAALDATNETESKLRASLDAKDEEAQTETAKLQAAHDAKTEAVEAIKAEFDKVEAELCEVRRDRDEARGALGHEREETSRLRGDAEASTKLRSELEARDRTIEGLRAEVASHETNVVKLQNELSARARELESLESQAVVHETERTELESQVAALRDSASQAKANEANAADEVKKIKHDMADTERRLGAATAAEREVLQSELSALRKRLEDADAAYHKKSAELAAAAEALEHGQERLRAKEQEWDETAAAVLASLHAGAKAARSTLFWFQEDATTEILQEAARSVHRARSSSINDDNVEPPASVDVTPCTDFALDLTDPAGQRCSECGHEQVKHLRDADCVCM